METPRLILHPLTAEELSLWVYDLPTLEKKLDVLYRATPMEGIFAQIVAGQIAPTQSDPDGFLWHTFWLLIRRDDRVVVGAADFKDRPDTGGEVEIGYGLGEAFEHRGYMTEAVTALCAFAGAQPGVRAVTAETECDGYASQKVLKRCGFRLYRRGETLWWKLSFPK